MKQFFSLEEASVICNCHHQTIFYNLRKGNIKGEKVWHNGRKRWEIPRSELYKMLIKWGIREGEKNEE